MWGFFALIVIGIGLVWYAGLQPQIPTELSFLKWEHHTSAPSGEAAPASGSRVAPLGSVTGATGWRLLSDSNGFEYSRDFEGPIRGGAQSYDAPIFGVTCYGNVPYVHVDTRLRAAGGKTVKVTFNGDTQAWARAAGQNLFAPDAVRILRGLAGRETAELQVAFDEAPFQSFTLKLTGIDKILDVMHRQCGLPR